MLTEKKLKKHLNRVWFHLYRLQNALNEAHFQDVLRYTMENQSECCTLLAKLKESFEKNTKEAISEVIHNQVREKVRGY